MLVRWYPFTIQRPRQKHRQKVPKVARTDQAFDVYDLSTIRDLSVFANDPDAMAELEDVLQNIGNLSKPCNSTTTYSVFFQIFLHAFK